MIAVRTPRDVMESRWAEHNARRRELAREIHGPEPRPMNLRNVLTLGRITYITFRGRPYGVPPLPWRAGETILDAYLELKAFDEPELSREDLPRYYGALRRLSSALWENTRSANRIRHLWRRLVGWTGLVRNPFDEATETELVEYALFMLGHRTRSYETGPTMPRNLAT